MIPLNQRPSILPFLRSKRSGVENRIGHLSASEAGPVNIKQWAEQGKCKHADMYLAQILDRLRPWSRGGIAWGMVEEAVRKGRDRSRFAGLHYQVSWVDIYKHIYD